MGKWLALLLGVIGASGRAYGVEPFFADPVPRGSIEIRLHATDVVAANSPQVASFGIPFPRSSLTPSQLGTLRVLSEGVEVPAYVEELTPWRHRNQSELDGTSVRVALVQVEVTFADPGSAKTLVVEWGKTPRQRHRPARATRATTWHRVNGGSFVAADNVYEPNVFVQLPAAWLSLGALRGAQALPFDATNTAIRDSPQAMVAITSWLGTQEAERAHKNNFYSVINEDSPGIASCSYKTDREPWLYDRSATMFLLHFRSGSVKALREAIRSADFYRAHLSASGLFSLAPTDSKYSSNEALAYAYWMTGDETFLPAISTAASAHDSSPHVWSTSVNFWTERMAAFKLLSHTIDYEVSGTVARRTSVDAMVAAFAEHQDGARLPIPANGRVDGAWYHTGEQHDASEMPAALYGASSWMTGLLTDALRRAYSTGEDAETADMIRRSGNFLLATLRSQAGGYNGATTTAARYIVQWDGQDFAQGVRVKAPEHSEEHSLDLAAALAWADYFGALLGQRDPRIAPAVTQVYATYDRSVNYWIRPAGPASGLAAFRVNPCRKWAWEHKYADSLSWAMAAAEVADSSRVFADSFEQSSALAIPDTP